MSVVGICKLCRNSGVELCDSHFLPKAAYKLLRESQSGESAIMMDSQVAICTDLQVRGYVFCSRCEDLLNKNGESWALKNCYRHGTGFALKNSLNGACAVHSGVDLTVYAASKVSGVNVPRLAYFAMSIFFRSAALDWKSGKSTPARIRLGAEYENEIRGHLLGKVPFPRNAALWVNVVTDVRLAEFCSFPYGGKERDYWKYDFQFMGLIFTLFVGRLVPQEVRRLCFVQSPEHFIGMSKAADDMILIAAGKLQTKSKPVGALKRWVETTSSR